MNTFASASGSLNGLVLLGSFATLLIGTILVAGRRHDPFRRLARFRVQRPRGIRFQRMSYATLGDSPTRRTWYRNALAYGLDAHSLYLRRSRLLPFFPMFWQLPRHQVRRHQHEYWTIRINAADPPVCGDFGPDFVLALRNKL